MHGKYYMKFQLINSSTIILINRGTEICRLFIVIYHLQTYERERDAILEMIMVSFRNVHQLFLNMDFFALGNLANV